MDYMYFLNHPTNVLAVVRVLASKSNAIDFLMAV
jgi:hypothetical protein